MNMNCTIPEIIELASFDGDYQAYETAVYAAYCECFQNKNFTFQGLKIGHKKHPEYKEKPATFWHIISQGPDESNREPDLRRYERIRWPSHILENCCSVDCDKLLIWGNRRNGKKRVLIFCVELDYLVVLDKREGYLIFWTAYPVNYPNQKQKLIKEYNEYMAKAAQPIG